MLINIIIKSASYIILFRIVVQMYVKTKAVPGIKHNKIKTLNILGCDIIKIIIQLGLFKTFG